MSRLNAPIHLAAIARHAGVELDLADWQSYGHDVPLLVNLQPAGEYLGEDYYHAGGVPAVVGQLISAGLIREDALTANGRSIRENCRDAAIALPEVIYPIAAPLMPSAGFTVLTGSLFDSAILKTSVISPSFRERFLANPADPEAFGARVIVFDGPEDYHDRIDEPALAIGANDMLIIRGCGPVGFRVGIGKRCHPGRCRILPAASTPREVLRGTATNPDDTRGAFQPRSRSWATSA